jgi:hypothetical protein
VVVTLLCFLCSFYPFPGINMRYLGAVARMTINAVTQQIMPTSVLDMIELEMVARSIRRIVRDYLQRVPELRSCPAPLFAKLLSCILGPAAGYVRLPPSNYNVFPQCLDFISVNNTHRSTGRPYVQHREVGDGVGSGQNWGFLPRLPGLKLSCAPACWMFPRAQ